jgi:hypothetical protein
VDKTQEGCSQFVVSSRYASAMLESVDEPFDDVAELVPLAIVTARAAVAARWDDRLGAGRANRFTQRIAVVPLVGNHVLGFDAFQQDSRASHVVAFPFGQMQLHRLEVVTDRDVDLGTEAPTGTSQRLGVLPPFAPAACWWARTIVESSSRFDNSESPPSVLSTRPQTSRLHQRLNRLYDVFHGPNRSGKSRHGAPVRAIQNTALTNIRLSWAVRPGSPDLPGSRGSIAVHCSSEISCRRISSSSMSQMMRHDLPQNGKRLKTNVHTT